ncbi:MAG: M28 family peptidase [Pyrinomonadaceae bacterium]
MRKNILLSLFITALLIPSAAFGQSVKLSTGERKMAEAITAEQLSNYLYFVASDAMGGRNTPSFGLDVTAEFLKMNLQRWGFKPAGDNGTFFQKIAIRSESTDPDNNKLSIGGQSFNFLDDFFRISGNASFNGPAVFVRDGWMVKSKNIDAYSGVDVKDKLVVVYGQGFPRGSRATSPPQGVTPADLQGKNGTDYADPITYARQKGAKGVVVIASAQVQPQWAQIKGFMGRGSSAPEKLREPNEFPVILVSGKVGDAIFAGESSKIDSPTSFALGKSIDMNVAAKVETEWTQNVVALWEGSDPVLKNEMVAIGAHYDHVGTNLNAPGEDKIWNGADDDGSGTVAVLSIAEALAISKARPKRSILFVWHCGEEKGLWGSEYFNKFPTVDIKNVVAQLNIDMIGRSKKDGDTNPKNKDLSGPDAIYVIGSEMMSSTLGAITKGTNDAFLKLDYDYRYDDPKDTNRFFFRSDHFNYAINGIPITFWFDGVHEDYHQASDTPDKIDYQKMEKVTRTIFLTMWELTDLKERPKIDKQLPPELSQR